jgi:hypothetical protein
MHHRVHRHGHEVWAVSGETEKAYAKRAWKERAVIEWRVLRGKTTPSEAEEWLTKKNVVENENLRLPPFQSNPDPARSDPMVQADWSLAMAAAWIIWRTPIAVREHWNDYLFQCKEWRRRKGNFADGRRWEGWELRQRKLVSLLDVIHEASEVDPAKMELNAIEAVDALWSKLTYGDVEATGIPSSPPGFDRLVIPRHAWIDLSKGHFHGGSPDSVAKINSDEPCYDEVRVLRAQICGFWEPRSVTSSMGAATRCRQWLIEQIKLSPSRRPRPKKEFRQSAKEEFKGLSGNQFDMQWNLAIEDQGATKWRQAGAPKKIKSGN